MSKCRLVKQQIVQMLVHIFGALSFKAAYILHITSFWGSAASLKDTWTDLFLVFVWGGGEDLQCMLWLFITTQLLTVFLLLVTLLAKQKKAQKVQFLYMGLCAD